MARSYEGVKSKILSAFDELKSEADLLEAQITGKRRDERIFVHRVEHRGSCNDQDGLPWNRCLSRFDFRSPIRHTKCKNFRTTTVETHAGSNHRRNARGASMIRNCAREPIGCTPRKVDVETAAPHESGNFHKSVQAKNTSAS